jgi:hypothetical protein
MATTRTEPRAGSSKTAAAPAGPSSWPLAVTAAGAALIAALATAFDLLPPAVGLAATVIALLVLLAERGLEKALAAATPGLLQSLAIGLVWVGVCWVPFQALLFPGAPLHDPIVVHGGETTGPLQIPADGRHAVDLLLEGTLPPNPTGGPAIPVSYAVTLEDAAHARTVVTGRFEENLRTRRVGRRGTATSIQTHHGERRLVSNAAGGDLTVTDVTLEPAAGTVVTITAHAHRLPSTPILALLGVAFVAAAVAVDSRMVPASEGMLTFATGGALGTALALWTSNVVHPTVSNLIGAIIFGGPIGLGLGALLWAIARRTLGHAGR